jgi:hypothetical protein
LRPKLAPEAVVAGLEVRTRHAFFLSLFLTSLFAASPFTQCCAIASLDVLRLKKKKKKESKGQLAAR